jgi:transposase
MSTSLLYHGFGLVGYEYIRTRYTGGAVIFFVKRKRGKIRCPVCRSRDIIFRGRFSRRFRIVPIGSKRVFLDYEVQRLECRRCGNIRQEKLGFADPRLSYTHAFDMKSSVFFKGDVILSTGRSKYPNNPKIRPSNTKGFN